MSWRYTPLVDTLSGLYYRTVTIETLIIQAGLSPGDYNLDGSAHVVWTLLINDLELKDRMQPLLDAALKKFPDNPVLLDYRHHQPVIRKSVYAGKQPIWKNGFNKDQFEKITGEQSTLLPISFLETGLQRSMSVARIISSEGMGTGFLVSEANLFLTNNHVFPTKEVAATSKVQFNYQKTVSGNDAASQTFDVDSSLFHTSEEDDWTLVRIAGDPAKTFGFLTLQQREIKADDFVNIIQHPGGEYKKIGLYHNVVTHTDNNVIQYLTDTMPGSSGSPVFNSKWEVVALHHSGGWLEEPGNGKPVLRNEGIRMNKILAFFEANSIQL